MDKTLWTASCFLILSGMLFLVSGMICQMYDNYREPLKGRTTAKVVELLLREPSEQDGLSRMPYRNCYYPVLEYYARGKLYKVVYPHGSYPSAFQINQELKLYYNIEDPEEYRIASAGTLKIVSQALYAGGVVCIAAGCIIFLIFALRG